MSKKRQRKKDKKRRQDPALSQRSSEETGLFTRSIRIESRADGTPVTLNETNRSVEVVAATENPVTIYDLDLGRTIDEVLLMSGVEMPPTKQVPLLDTHSRCTTADIIGSLRDMAVSGPELRGRVVFSGTEEAQGPYQKVREGHLTDFSVGYRVMESVYIPEGQSQTVDGQSFDGPIKVVTRWQPRELSACPIGADPAAKARSATAEPLTEKRDKEDDEMNEKLRSFLESRGLAKDATEAEAWAFLEGLDVRTEPQAEPAAPAAEGAPATEGAPAANGARAAVPDPDAIRAEAVRAEQSRILEIRTLCARANADDLAEEFIRGNVSVDEAARRVLDRVVSTAPTADGAGYRAPIEVTRDERDKVRDAAIDSILIRSGRTPETPAPGAHDMAGLTLRELARDCLRRARQPIYGNPLEMVGRALSTSDFPNILAATANKALFAGYEAANETWNIWCDTGSVSDFKDHTSNRVSETDDLDEIPEGREYKYDSPSDAKETYKVVTYGKIFSITRQAIINDDLGALTKVPAAHGEAASRKIGDVAYAVLTANAAMGDGIALFHSSHANVATAAALAETSIAEMIKLMKLQKDLNGKRRLNIQPRYYIAPVALEGSAEVFFNSGQFAGGNAAATRTNPYAGSKFTRVYEPRLDDASATAWYLAGPKGKTVTVFFLNGNQAPYMETKQGWNTDGVEYKVRMDAGAKALDWRALVMNAGV